jgi:transcription antitermination factor NusG
LSSLAALEESARKNKVPWNQIDKKEAVSLIGGEFESIMQNYKEINPTTGQKQSVSNYLYNIMGDRVGSKLTAEWKRKQQQVSQDVLTEKGISPEVSTS